LQASTVKRFRSTGLRCTTSLPALVHAGFHVVAMDLPGFGDTSKPKDHSYSISEQARFVESFLDALHLERVALVGVSMGGWIVATVALDAPQRVERLVLMDSAGFAYRLSFDTELFTPRTPAEVDALLALLEPQPEWGLTSSRRTPYIHCNS